MYADAGLFEYLLPDPASDALLALPLWYGVWTSLVLAALVLNTLPLASGAMSPVGSPAPPSLYSELGPFKASIFCYSTAVSPYTLGIFLYLAL